VAVPSEHGGWGLTLEPVLLGLIVEPGIAGAALGLAAVLAFLARTPLKLLLVDAHRGRTLARTRLARRVLAVEVLLLAGLVAAAVIDATAPFWAPLAVAAPLLALDLWFDMRSRGRRLLPELCGSIGIGSVAAAIVLAGGGDGTVAIAVWLVLVARAVTAIVSVRDLVGALHGRDRRPGQLVVADLVAVAVAAAAVVVDRAAAAGAAAVIVVIGVQRLLATLPTKRAVVLGLRQTALGLFVVALCAIGVLAS
jgi:hypothetical protein